MKRRGRKSAAQTPALAKERISGSSTNPAKSAASKKSGASIKFTKSILNTLSEKAKKYNEKHPNNKVSVSTLKAVMRRGMGAFSTSHRPGMTRQGWGYARVNKFLLKKGGTKVKAAYVQDDDLMARGGTLDQVQIVETKENGRIVEVDFKIGKKADANMWLTDIQDVLDYYPDKIRGRKLSAFALKETFLKKNKIKDVKQKAWNLNSIEVEPKYRGKGLASLLLKAIIKYCKKKKIDTLFLYRMPYDVWDESLDAKQLKKFYERYGFVEIASGIMYKKIQDDDLMERGGGISSPDIEFMKWYVDWYKSANKDVHVSISIPNEFSSPTKDGKGKIVILDVIEKKGDADAKKYMNEILEKADELGVSIYLQPIPRTHNLKSEEHKKKITKDYLTKYYEKFGFKNTNGGFMVREPKMDSDGMMEKGGQIDQMIKDGIVELKMYDTTKEHSKLYGFDAQKPLYIHSLVVEKEHRMNGVGSRVMQYIIDYAERNGNDVIFGHITQKAEPSIDVIKSMLIKSGFETINGNNDFYKLLDANNSDISYKEGGEIYRNLYQDEKIKKAYVSIRISYDIERDMNTFNWRYKNLDEKPFEELESQKLVGIRGISTSNYNVSDWFVNRDCLIVMPFDKFLQINDTEQIKYNDPYYLTKDGLRVFYRLYNQKEFEQENYKGVLQNIFKHIQKEFILESEANKNLTKLYNISQLYNIYNSADFVKYISRQERVNNPEDLARLTIQYINSDELSDYYKSYTFRRDWYSNEYSVEELVEPIKNGIIEAASIYQDESEWIINDLILNIPSNSQLFLKKRKYENEVDVYQNIIKKFNLNEIYKIYFVSDEYLTKLQSQRFKKKEEKFKKELESLRSRVDKKIGNALIDIENKMLEVFEYNFNQSIKNDEFLQPEYFKDYDGNNLGSNILDIPEVNNLYLSFLTHFVDEYDKVILKIIETKNKYFLNDFEYKILNYINQLREDTFSKDFEFTDEYGGKYRYYNIVDKIKYAYKEIPFSELIDTIKERVGSDLYRAYTKTEISLKKGGELPHKNDGILNENYYHSTNQKLTLDTLDYFSDEYDYRGNSVYITNNIDYSSGFGSNTYVVKLKKFRNLNNTSSNIEKICKYFNLDVEDYDSLIDVLEYLNSNESKEKVRIGLVKLGFDGLLEKNKHFTQIALWNKNVIDTFKVYSNKKKIAELKKGGDLPVGKLAKGISFTEIARMHKVSPKELKKELTLGIRTEREHTDDVAIARAIALDHLYENPKYYTKLKSVKLKKGGVVVGKSHQEYDENGSGEKFVVESTGQVVELEGGESVIVAKAMKSKDKLQFQGEEKTPREIASFLNSKYGGVSFKKGGKISCGCEDKRKYYHGGELPSATVKGIEGGEAVITKKTMYSKDKYEFEGQKLTPRQILSKINKKYGGVSF